VEGGVGKKGKIKVKRSKEQLVICCSNMPYYSGTTATVFTNMLSTWGGKQWNVATWNLAAHHHHHHNQQHIFPNAV